MEKIIKNKINLSSDRVKLIPNWADCDVIHPSQRSNNSLIKELKLHNKFILQFAGNLGRLQGLEIIIEAAKLIKDESIHFLFIGDGAMKNIIENNIRLHKLKNISLIGNQPRQSQATFLNACDVALISLSPGMLGMGVPSKTYNIMAAGKPIIAVVDTQSEIGLVVEEEGIGWVVPPGDIDQLLRIILKAKANPDCLKKMGDNARYIAETKYSFPYIAKAYNELIQEAFLCES
jgi:glycosyltransferase involved in cell wall biosynthesis